VGELVEGDERLSQGLGVRPGSFVPAVRVGPGRGRGRGLAKEERMEKPSIEVVKAILSVVGGDVPGIYPLATFPDVAQEWVKPLLRTYKSDGTPKGSITSDSGKSVKAIEGVYSLDLLRAVGDALGVTWQEAFGRGTEARRITAAILEAITK